MTDSNRENCQAALPSKELSVGQLQKLQRSVAEIGDQHGIVVAAWLIRAMCDRLLQPNAPETPDALSKVYDAFMIGSAVRTPAVLLANVENSRRRSDCLSAIEREFFTETVKDEDGEDTEECGLSWGAEPAEYVEQFRAALTARAALKAVAAPEASIVKAFEQSPRRVDEPRCECGISEVWPEQFNPNCPRHKHLNLQAWKDLAMHLRYCVQCSETDVQACDEGKPLWDVCFPENGSEQA